MANVSDIPKEHPVDQKEEYGSTCQYELKNDRFIGKGTFGTVFNAAITEYGDFTGKDQVAVKVIHFDQKQSVLAYVENWTELVQRWKSLLQLKHEHLLPFHKVTIIPALKGKAVEFMMDYCNGGDLTEVLETLRKEKKKLSQSEVICYGLQVADGLQYLHKEEIIHGDLKPENVLMKIMKSSPHKRLLIGDLDDLVKMHRSNTTVRDIQHRRGTVRYMSPEMLRKPAAANRELVGRKTDVWSLGCVILELLNCSIGSHELYLHKTGQPNRTVRVDDLLGDIRFGEMVDDGWSPFVSDTIPEFLSECVRPCLILDSAERTSAIKVAGKLRETVQLVQDGSDTVTPGQCVCRSHFEAGCSSASAETTRSSELMYDSASDDAISKPNEVEVETFGSSCQYRYSSADCIGSGAFGTVYRAKITEWGDFIGDEIVAVKSVFISDHGDTTLSKIDDIVKDLRKKWTALLFMQHPHLVSYHKAVFNKKSGFVAAELMMDYCNGGDMGFLLKPSDGLDRLAAICYIAQIADGLSFLHRNRIIHGDLKPENVLVKLTSSKHHSLLIGDADDIVTLRRSVTSVGDISHLRGTVRYMSPEMLSKFIVTSDDILVGRKTDIWSLGCIALLLVNCSLGITNNWLINKDTEERFLLPDNYSPNFLILKIMSGFVPFVADSVPHYLSKCIRQSLCEDSANRISAEGLLQELQKAIKIVGGCFCGQQTRIKSQTKQTGNAILIINHLKSHGSFSNISAQLYNPVFRAIHSIPLPTELRSRKFLVRFALMENDIICHINQPSQRTVETVACNFAQRTLRTLFSNSTFHMASATAVENRRLFFWNRSCTSSPLSTIDISEKTVSALPKPVMNGRMPDSKVVRWKNLIICCANDDCEAWVKCFDEESRQWKDLPDMLEAKQDYAIINVGKYVYILGGTASNGSCPVASVTCQRLDMETRTWNAIGDLMRPRFRHGTFLLGDRIYVFGGGEDEDSGTFKSMEVYDSELNVWSDVELANPDDSLKEYEEKSYHTICVPVTWPELHNDAANRDS